MAINLVDVNIPENFIPFIYQMKDGKNTSEKVTLSLAIGFFTSKLITLEKAAELAQKNTWEFIDILKSQNIAWGEYSEDSLKMDELAINKLESGYYNL